MDIGSTTLLQAARIIAPAYGLDFEQNRDRVIGYVNRYRELLYNLYPTQKLFDDYYVCCVVEQFTQKCNDPNNCADNSFYGITIPSNMSGVEAAWQYQAPLMLRSRWREVHTGIHTGNHDHMSLVELMDTSPTERQMTAFSQVGFFTYDERDEGKVVTISGMEEGGNRVKARVTLCFDTLVYTDKTFCKIDSVVLPDLCGSIEFMQREEGVTLSYYRPHEHIPRYRRFKLNNRCATNHLLIRGTRKYEDISLDDDIVEIGSRLALEAAGRYFKYAEDTMETQEIKAGEYQYGKLEAQIDAIVQRHRGRMFQDRAPARNSPKNLRGGLHIKR